MNRPLFLWILFLLIFADSIYIHGQNTNTSIDGKQANSTVPIGVPFLLISPDARSSSLGDAGVSTGADVYSAHWNAAKLVQIEGDYGVGISYVPWLRKLVPDLYLATATGFKKISEDLALGLSIYYFNLGKTSFKDESGYLNGVGYPNEFSLEGTFSQKFGRNFSLGFTAKYIHSDVSNGQIYQGVSLSPGNSEALDISFYYKKAIEKFNPTFLSWGIAISNIGPKISYGINNAAFLPANLRIGFTYGRIFHEVNRTNFSLDLNKLLVPSTPLLDANGNIIAGRNPNQSVLSSLISSFYDAPGGFRQELQEISISPGFEYIYDKTLSLRTGLFLENKNAGNRKYLNAGFGLKIKSNFDFNISYLYNLEPTSSLTNTFRISLGIIL